MKGDNVVEAVGEKHVTVFSGHTATTDWRRCLYISAVHKFFRAPVDAHIVTHPSP